MYMKRAEENLEQHGAGAVIRHLTVSGGVFCPWRGNIVCLTACGNATSDPSSIMDGQLNRWASYLRAKFDFDSSFCI